jgi:7-cyano-7-deazaguanine synthase
MVNLSYEPHLLSFDYGQRHKKELQYAGETAFKLGLRHDIVDLTGLTRLISNSSLTSQPDTIVRTGAQDYEVQKNEEFIDVPEGHYAEDNMKLTVVPNRNMIMLSIAAGVAVNNSYKCVATGVHAGDHFVYPDCRPKFMQLIDAAILAGNEGFGPFENNKLEYTQLRSFLYTPFMHATKTDIAQRAFELEVPLADTWSCYKGGEIHCGRCGTCVERLEAIHDAALALYGEKAADMGFFDPTKYEDTEFWKTVVANA